MENKKLGILLIILGVLIGGAFIYYGNTLSVQSRELGCFEEPDCLSLEKGLTVSHFSVGVFSFIIALGFYLLFFNKSKERKTEKDKEQNVEDEKFNFALKLLDPFETKVLKKIREDDGITQNILKSRLNMSKAKLSYVLQDLEKKGLVKRIKKGKTLEIYIKL